MQATEQYCKPAREVVPFGLLCGIVSALIIKEATDMNSINYDTFSQAFTTSTSRRHALKVLTVTAGAPGFECYRDHSVLL